MIRTATENDIERITEIYNQAIAARFQTAHTAPVSTEERLRWFQSHSASEYPVLVNEAEGVVAGWLSISPYRSGRMALRECVEVSYYVDAAFRGRGIGKVLLGAGIDAARSLNYHSMIAIILDRNLPSIELMKRFGFEQWAHLPLIANFDGERCGHVYYGMHLR